MESWFEVRVLPSIVWVGAQDGKQVAIEGKKRWVRPHVTSHLQAIEFSYARMTT